MDYSNPAAPTQDGIGRHDRGDLAQRLAAKQFSLHGETPALIVVEQDSFLPNLLLEQMVFGAEVLDDMLLFLFGHLLGAERTLKASVSRTRTENLKCHDKQQGKQG